MTPALAMITSNVSPFLSNASAHALTLVRLARSRAITSKLPPFAAASFLTLSVAASAFFRSRAAPTTSAPCAASERAVSTPSPEETPVTRTRLPLRFTPDRTSSVVEVSPNTFAIVFLLLFFPLATGCFPREHPQTSGHCLDNRRALRRAPAPAYQKPSLALVRFDLGYRFGMRSRRMLRRTSRN